MPNERFMRHHYGASGYVPPADVNKAESEGANERFEVLADLFKMSTGFLAPGKSVPPDLASGNYEEQRELAWEQWTDTHALNMALKYIQALRHNEAQHDKLYNALVLSDCNQVLQERDALRLRIKAVDEEHEQIKKERERMIQAYTAIEQERDFWKSQHEGLMDTLRQVQSENDALWRQLDS